MNVRLPEGLSSRPANAADAGAIYELIAACELEDDGVVEVVRYEVTVAFERHGFEPDLNTLLVFDGETLAAWAELYRSRAEADVRPTHRGRGIGTALLGRRRKPLAPVAGVYLSGRFGKGGAPLARGFRASRKSHGGGRERPRP